MKFDCQFFIFEILDNVFVITTCTCTNNEMNSDFSN